MNNGLEPRKIKSDFLIDYYDQSLSDNLKVIYIKCLLYIKSKININFE